uniref:Protein shisa-5-like isoform X2 n=1 Tax=Crassostrea virginica TaxID=6565 RepID=A0A8B8BIU1_CRAVI|nr:protein shisa-5-like isoform X2 [Crassostrea virginica]XP_022302744.1 protein shisa-5-like isoform X2 [Crassostrea virginica]
MAVSPCSLFLCVLAVTFCSVAGSTYSRGAPTYDLSDYYSDSTSTTSVGTIIGAIVGGIVGLIVLCVVSVVVCVVCCKKKPTPGTIIHPAGVTTVTSNSASYNAHPSYPPQHQQGWGVQPSAPYYGQQQAYPPPPVSQPMPPPAYAENVISAPPPQYTG